MGELIPQQTIAAPFTVSGRGLHTGRKATVTVSPGPVGSGWRIASARGALSPVQMTWENRVPSIMSTAFAVGDGRTIRTVEHLMASLSAFAIDNVLVRVDGEEIPILDGSSRIWCQALSSAGQTAQNAARRYIRVLKPVQVVSRDGGFLRVEPAEHFAVDVTNDLVHSLPVARWAGRITRDSFLHELASARSFGHINWRQLLGLHRGPKPLDGAPVPPNLPDPTCTTASGRIVDERFDRTKMPAGTTTPVLHGARPWAATFVLNGRIFPNARYRDEPVRHVALDMIGDLALAGAALLGRVVAHTPSHAKTFVLVQTLMSERSCWEYTSLRNDSIGAAEIITSLCRQILGRDPHPVELRYHYRNFHATGLDSVLSDFVNSAEFRAKQRRISREVNVGDGSVG